MNAVQIVLRCRTEDAAQAFLDGWWGGDWRHEPHGLFDIRVVPVQTWVFILCEMAASKNGISRSEIRAKYRLTPLTSRQVFKRLRSFLYGPPYAPHPLDVSPAQTPSAE